MKLYHIDRSCKMKCGVLNLNKHPNINANSTIKNMLANNLMNNHKNGLSFHGEHYYTYKISDISTIIDIVFEYERQLNFPKNISRYECFFAFDKEGVIKFLSEYKIKDYKIFEVESAYYEKHNMRLLKGDIHFVISELAKSYWANTNKYNIDKDNPLYEYLLKFPINIVKEIKLEELK